MSVPMKKLPTRDEVKVQVGKRSARLFLVPRDRVRGLIYLIQDFEVDENEQTVPFRETVSDLIKEYTEAGFALRGARVKEGLSQTELAEKMGLPQTHISAMETGRRTIGKKMAKRLSRILKIDYRVFL